MNQWNILKELLSNITVLEKYYEMTLNFQDSTLQKRHWDEFKQLLNISCDNSMIFFHSPEFTFGFLRRINIEDISEKVNKITLCSRKEYEIEQVCNLYTILIGFNLFIKICFMLCSTFFGSTKMA